MQWKRPSHAPVAQFWQQERVEMTASRWLFRDPSSQSLHLQHVASKVLLGVNLYLVSGGGKRENGKLLRRGLGAGLSVTYITLPTLHWPEFCYIATENCKGI